jgi:hypothetical protein
MNRIPSQLERGLFIVSLGFVLVGLLFTILKIPANDLFSCLGGAASIYFYVRFQWVTVQRQRSDFARHVAFSAFIIGQVLKSVDVAFGIYLFLLALIAFLVWVGWSVLASLPGSEE